MRTICVLEENGKAHTTAYLWAECLSKAFSHAVKPISVSDKTTADTFAQELEQYDTSLLIIELADRKKVQKRLNICRSLRIPYLFVPSDMPFDLQRVSLPCSFLVEDKEKLLFASALGRFCKTEILIYHPKDYGDKAKETIAQAKTLFDSFGIKYKERQGKKGSFGIDKEAVKNVVYDGSQLVIVSASRQYGLDDIIFGSKEKQILQNTKRAIMLVNPRADLYMLCQ